MGLQISRGIYPKYSISDVVEFMKGKSANSRARNFSNRKRNFSRFASYD
jgi:hypothetical protein